MENKVIHLKNDRVDLLWSDGSGQVEIVHQGIILNFTLDGTVSDPGAGVYSTTLEGIIQRIVHCPFEGQVRDMFLEAKVLELAAMYLDAASKNPEPYVYCKSEYDRERLFFAKNYLLQHYELPPTIAELSRIAGINAFKLKNGFKELFGDTIHHFVHRYKMDIALKRLTEGQTKASQIAFDLGFSSLQHFSKAFRKEFGYPPSRVNAERK